jgi:hypothetical protein
MPDGFFESTSEETATTVYLVQLPTANVALLIRRESYRNYIVYWQGMA